MTKYDRDHDDTPPDDLLEELAAGAKWKHDVGLEPTASGVVARTQLAAIYQSLVDVGDAIRDSVPEIKLEPVDRMTPEARSELAIVRMELDRIGKDVFLWRDAIDLSFRRAAIKKHAKEIRLANGNVKIAPPRDEWIVGDPRALREALYERPELSREEVDAAFTEKSTVTANNTKLNAYAANRGDAVAAIIDAARIREVGDPLRSTLTYSTGDRRVKRG